MGGPNRQILLKFRGFQSLKSQWNHFKLLLVLTTKKLSILKASFKKYVMLEGGGGLRFSYDIRVCIWKTIQISLQGGLGVQKPRLMRTKPEAIQGNLESLH